MKTVANVIGVARSSLAQRARHRQPKRIGRPPQPDEALVAEIKAVIADLPTYGYRRVHAILRRRALAGGRQPPNHKRVYGAMRRHGLLLVSAVTMAGSRLPSRTCAGARMASRSPATTARGSG